MSLRLWVAFPDPCPVLAGDMPSGRRSKKIVPPTMLLRTHVVREQACCMLFPSTDLANASTSTGAIVSTSTVLNCNCHLFSFLAIVCIKVSTSVSGVLTVWNPAARISARVC